MAVQYKTQALVFRCQDSIEADRSFSIFTYDFGRLEVVGKAIRKITSKLKGNIEVFSLSEIEFIQGKNKKILTDSLFLKKFKNIPQSPEKLGIAYKISDILDTFLKGEQKDEKIWGLLIDVFGKLNNNSLQDKHCPLLYYYFVGNFIHMLGYGPEVSKCAGCGQKLDPRILYFSNKEGGVICGKCSNTHESSANTTSDAVKVLRLILKKDWQTLYKLKADVILQASLQVLDGYVEYLLAVHSFKK